MGDKKKESYLVMGVGVGGLRYHKIHMARIRERGSSREGGAGGTWRPPVLPTSHHQPQRVLWDPFTKENGLPPGASAQCHLVDVHHLVPSPRSLELTRSALPLL